MAKVTVYHPAGFPVEVDEERAAVLVARGYKERKTAAKKQAKE